MGDIDFNNYDVTGQKDYLKYFKMYSYPKKIRLGNDYDGGYVIGDININYDCYISAGVSYEDSFSRDFIPRYNMNRFNSFAFDGTINSYPEGFTKDITFVKKNINIFDDKNNTTLYDLLKEHNNIFLKMDIEGCEYPWFSKLPMNYLRKIKQLTVEFHKVNEDSFDAKLEEKIKCWEKICTTHYLIHAHANNWSETISDNIPCSLEFTYVVKDYFQQPLKLNISELPINIDRPNNQQIPEIALNFYPFVNFDIRQLFI